MRSVSIRVYWVWAVLALAWLSVLPTVAIGADRCGSLDRVMVALRLTEVLYPELRGHEFSVSFTAGLGDPSVTHTTVGNLGIMLERSEPAGTVTGGHLEVAPQADPTPKGEIDVPAYFEFSFIDYSSGSGGHLVCRPNFMNNTTSTQMKEALEVINAHPEWTDGKELEVAIDHGLRFSPNNFGPNDNKPALLKLIPLKELSRFYGPLRIRTADFEINGGEKCAGCSFGSLYWNIDAEEVGTHQMVSIRVEPFWGKVVGIISHSRR